MMPTSRTYEAIVFNPGCKENVPQAYNILMHRAIDTAVFTLDRVLVQGLATLAPRDFLTQATAKAYDGSRVEVRISSTETSSVVMCEASMKKKDNHMLIFNNFFTTAFKDGDLLQENRATYLHIVRSINALISALLPGDCKSTKSTKTEVLREDSSLDASGNVGHVWKAKNPKKGGAGSDWEIGRLGGCLMPCDLPNRPYENPLLLMVTEDRTKSPKAGNCTFYEVPDHFIAQQIKDITAWAAARDAGDNTCEIPLAAVPQTKVHSLPTASQKGPKSAKKIDLTGTYTYGGALGSRKSKRIAELNSKGKSRKSRRQGESFLVNSNSGGNERGQFRDESEEKGTISGDDAESGDDEYEQLVQMGLALTAEQRELKKAGWRF